jgi:xanthine dehydrogenase YagR molybdenum-binding subunit
MATTATTGVAVDRVEGREKVTGAARYAAEYPAEGVAYAHPVQSTIAKGLIRSIDADAALSLPGVLAVIWHEDAPELKPVDYRELMLFQFPQVLYRGQIVAMVVAESLETARQAAALVRVEYERQNHDVELRADRPDLYKPDKVNPSFATDTEVGDFDTAFAGSARSVDHSYSTPAYHNNPMEMHSSLAHWDGDRLTLYESSQGSSVAQSVLADLFGLGPENVHVISRHVGGGFGSKGRPQPHAVVAAVGALVTRRPVKAMLTRQQMFSVAGYRTPTIQRIRLGGDADGRLVAISHDVVEQTSLLTEFAEQTAVCTRWMYAAPNRRTTHRLARLDVPTPFWMRAPGECPGMYALESAMDELAIACAIDPVELRIANEPDVHPEEGIRWSSRNLVACLREGAERFGWSGRDPTPGVRREGDWLVGTGVASSTYPTYMRACSASARAETADEYVVRINATDIGTGARTVLTQLAAETLGCDLRNVRVEIGDSDLPAAGVAGGSMGTSSWGTGVVKACAALRERIAEAGGAVPGGGLEVSVDTEEDVNARGDYAFHAFGAQFVEVHVHSVTREVRVPRITGVFAAGRILNPKTARSQLIGGMTMGISMALHEESIIDPRFGDYVNHDFATYHIPVHADIGDVDASFIEETDSEVTPIGTKGVGEIGIVGTAAAVANAVHHATGIRVRDLPIRLDKLVP